MLSESQERMSWCSSEKEAEAEAIFRNWASIFAIVGNTTPSKRFIVKHAGDVMADLPIKELGRRGAALRSSPTPNAEEVFDQRHRA